MMQCPKEHCISSPLLFNKYRIAGFFCEVLICANYARRCGLADFIIADITAGLKNYAKRCGLADFIIADITAGLKNCMFAEIAPRRKTPLYGTYVGIIYDHRIYKQGLFQIISIHTNLRLSCSTNTLIEQPFYYIIMCTYVRKLPRTLIAIIKSNLQNINIHNNLKHIHRIYMINQFL